LDSGVELASAVSELDLAGQYATESVTLTEQRTSADDPETQRDLAWSLVQLGDVSRDLGNPTTAATYHQEALNIDRRLAEQLGTLQALRNLRTGLTDLARTEEELGNTERAAALRAEAAAVSASSPR
jgi:tetratricopeptide (TPR) repeat protein